MLRRSLRTAAALPLLLAAAPVAAQYTSFSTIATNAYFAGDINSCAIQVNNLTTAGGYQFAAYYDTSRRVMIARRAVGSPTWTTFNSGFSVSSSEITDDHNVIAMAVDSAGYMHLSWNMHNVSLNYATSNVPVTGASLPTLSFTKRSSTNAPTLFPDSGITTNSVTYPQFYSIPNGTDLLFTYRNGGAGGGSGNGDQYFNVYSPATGSWTNRLVINGEATNVNAYLNSLAYTSTNDLLMSWTWRASPNWQTNSDVMFAQSPDNGTTWYHQGGTNPYTLPIIQSGSPATSVADVVKAIPQNSSFINQTSMTVDGEDNPLVATYYAPGWNAASNSGNPNRQYMLVYYDGTQWRTSQITDRTSDTAIDTSGGAVRDLGRPVVLVDPQGRVLVVTRSEDTAMGSYSNASTPDNEIVVYYNTVDSLRSASPAAWRSVTLDTANMGSWEPTYDHALWDAQHKFDLFYEPVGLSGQTGSALKVLEWDEQSFFANLTLYQWALATGGSWDTPGNWTGAAVPNAVAAVANFGNGPNPPTADSTIAVTGTKTVGVLTFDSPTYAYTLTGGGSLVLNNGSASPASVSVNSGNHVIALPISLATTVGATFFTAANASLAVTGNIPGAGGLTKTGNGTLVLSGDNSYSGATVVAAGTLRLASSSSLPTGSNLSLTGGLVELSGILSRAVGAAAGQVQLPSGTTGFSAGGGDATVSVVNGGVPITWGSAVFNPSTLVLNSPTAAGNLTLAGDIDLNGAARAIRVNANAATLAGSLSGPTGSLQVFGSGTLVLASANTYGGGTSLSPGVQGPATLRVAATNALGTGTVNLGTNGNAITTRLELTNNITLPNPVAFTGRTNNSVAVENLAGSNTLSGTVTLNVGGSVYRIQSDAGTLTLSGSTALTSAATGTRLVTLQGVGDGLISGDVVNGNATLGIAKIGGGTWTLAGSNSYTGLTTVAGGTLAFRGPSAWSPVLTGPAGADVQDGRLLFDYTGATSPRTVVFSALTSGQVRSTTADADHTLGWSDDGASLLSVMYTYYGDLNLDGRVNADDYALIDRGFNAHLSGWSNGDLNYDNAVDSTDYLLMDTAYGHLAGQLSPALLAEREARFGPGYVADLIAAVPEPASLWVLGVGGLGLVSRRRRDVRQRRKAQHQLRNNGWAVRTEPCILQRHEGRIPPDEPM